MKLWQSTQVQQFVLEYITGMQLSMKEVISNRIILQTCVYISFGKHFHIFE